MVDRQAQKRPSGITIIAIWYFFLALYNLSGLVGITAGLAGLWPFARDSIAGMELGTFGVIVRILASLLYGLGAAVVAWGLWTLKSWAWGAGLVLGILLLPGIPIGTFVGAVTIFYLLKNPNVKTVFRSGR